MNDSKLNVVLHRAGDPVPVTLEEDKCLIRTAENNRKVDCCAIFNGPFGTAIRSYVDNVLVNGEPTSVRWLNPGDEIQLPCSTRIEVRAATPLRTVALPAVENGDPGTGFAKTTATSSEVLASQPESVFANMGMTHMDSTSNLPSEPVITPAMPQQNQLTAGESDYAASVRSQLESLFPEAGVGQPTTASSPNTSALPPAEAPAMAATTPQTAPELPTVESVQTPVAVPLEVAAPDSMQVPVQENRTPSQDPLSELPEDLRNQLNSLVSSLEKEAPASQSQNSAENSVLAQPPALHPAEQAIPASTPGSESPAQVEAISENPGAASTPVAQAPSTVVEAPPAQGPVAEASAPPSRPQQSVADILGAMGMAVPGAEEMDAPEPVAAESNPAPVAASVPAPEPVAAEPQNVPSTPVFASSQEQHPVAESASGGSAEDDIQAYMNRLLNRSEPSTPAANTSAAEAPEPAQVVAAEPVQKVLSAEEFVPTHKATRPENYDTLREIANTCSRTAIRQSTRKAEKEGILIKIIACLVSLIGAGVMYWLGIMVPAVIFVVIALMCLILCYLRKEDPVPAVKPNQDNATQLPAG